MIGPYVLAPPRQPETWVQVSNTTLKVMGGVAGIIAFDSNDRAWRHTADGRLWKRVRP